MKKQILLVVLFVLAIFSSLTEAFGQSHYSAPRVLSCVDDALHPIAGVRYTYTADVNDTNTGKWRFWATKDVSFITDNNGTPVFNTGTALTVTDGELSYASDDYNIEITTTAGNTDGTIELTWTSNILANTEYQSNPTFIVAYYVNDNGCTDNIKVWELDPLNGFTVDVLAIDPDAVTTAPDYTVVPTTCFDNVESATYNAGAMVYDYGENYVYFEFVASNFTDYWIPTFELSGVIGGQSVISYEYTTDLPTAWGTTTWQPLTSATTQLAVGPTVDTSNGVSYFVRALVDHDDFEGIPGQTLTMTVDGENAAGEWDVVNGTANDTCEDPEAADLNDTATVTFDPRPEIPAATSTTSPTPNNTQLIPGNEVND